MSKLVYLNVKLFGIFKVFKDKKGVLTIKVKDYNAFVQYIKKSKGIDWLFKHIKNRHHNQYGVFIKLKYEV